jgi:hypothetical protein
MAPPFVIVTETGSLVGKVSFTAWSSFRSRLSFEFSGRLLSLSGICVSPFNPRRARLPHAAALLLQL